MGRTPYASLLFFTTSLVLAGCDCAGSPPGRACTSRDDCRAGEQCLDGECSPGTDASGFGPDSSTDRPDTGAPRTITSLRLEPAAADLIATDGAMPTQTFQAIFLYSDDTEATAPGPAFAIDNVSLGDLDVASGVFAANGAIGGTATITGTVPDPAGGADLSATATLRVRLDRTLGLDVIPDAATRFGAATEVDDATRAAGVVYPLDGVVMPQNVYPADVQWTNGAGGDLYRVRMVKPDVTITSYVAYDGQNHWLAEAGAWRSIAQTDPDAAATLTVDRLVASSGEVVRGTPLSMTFARAALTGSVYYWDIERGRVVRIDDGTASRVEFLPNPSQGCVGCHSVSPSGRYMAGRFGGGDNFGSVMDLTTDLTANPAPTLWSATSQTWWFSSWSPDETRLVVARYGGDPVLGFIDPISGADVPVTGALPRGTYPSWSPDGTRIAYISEQNGWGDGPTSGNVYVLPVTAADTIGAPTRIHVASTIPGATTDSYPSWSPDSAHIAFASGNGARSESSAASLYLMQPDGADVVSLARGSGTGLDYQPRFSPFQQGGYYWMSFLSRRVYGNPQIGNGTRPASRMQQIWVTAIRVGAPAGEDASQVPYWLPGQNPQSANISAYWAPRACRPDGEGCSVGSECCGGDCRPPAGGGAPVCSPPPPERCRMSGETCGGDGDCCPDMGLSCIGHVCVAGPG